MTKSVMAICVSVLALLFAQRVTFASAPSPKHHAQWIHFENAETRAAKDHIYKQRGKESVLIHVYARPDKTSPVLGHLEITFKYYSIEPYSWIAKLIYTFGGWSEDVYFVQNGKRTYVGPGENEAIGAMGYPFLKHQGNWFMLPPGPYPQKVWVELGPGPEGHNIRTTHFESGPYMLGAPRCEGTQVPRKDCWPEMVEVIRSTTRGVYYYPENTPNISCISDTGANGPCRCTRRPCPSLKFIPWKKVFDANGVSILDPQVGC